MKIITTKGTPEVLLAIVAAAKELLYLISHVTSNMGVLICHEILLTDVRV